MAKRRVIAKGQAGDNPPADPEIDSVEGQDNDDSEGATEDEAEKEDTVTMVFPCDVVLTTDDGSKIHFKKGIHEVNVSHSDHWYLAARGVELYEKD